MNYPAALRSYIQTMALGSNFFLKPPPFSADQEDKMLSKVIKCLTDMGCNSYAAFFCQCLSGEVDYSTAFKCLEERGTGICQLWQCEHILLFPRALLPAVTVMEFCRGHYGRGLRQVVGRDGARIRGFHAHETRWSLKEEARFGKGTNMHI